MPNVSGGQFLSGGGGSANALGTLIQTQTLGAPTASVTFSAIPQTYNHLKLFVAATVASGGFLQLNFNGDVGTNYSNNGLTMSFNATTALSGAFGQAGAIIGSLNTNAGSTEINLLGYNLTGTVKTFFSMSLGSLFFIGGGIWGTSNITSIVATNTNGGNFNAGSVFSLYGIK